MECVPALLLHGERTTTVPDQSTAVVILNESEARQLTEEIKLQLSIHAKSGEKVLAQLRIVDEARVVIKVRDV